jgi:uncharacterized protein
MLKSLSESKNKSLVLRNFLVSKPLTSFFVMACLFSWIVLIPYILSQWNILPKSTSFDLFFVANAFVGPMLAAYIMIRTLEGKDAWKRFRKSIWKVKVGLKWYLFALLFIPAVMYIGMVIVNGGIPKFEGLTAAFFITYPFYLVAVFFGGGPFPEEIGWRGFALPRMQAKFGPLKATMLLSILWAFWHLPHFLTTAQKGGPDSSLSTVLSNMPIFLILCVAISIILTWVFNCKQGNLFIVMLVHASLNTFSLIQPFLANSALRISDLSFTIGLGILALVILTVTKGKLGYRQISHQVEFTIHEEIAK